MVRLSKTKTFLLHLNASEETFSRSAKLRKSMTDAEKILWHFLKDRKLNDLKFRRQHPIHFYIADFYCHELKLIIEVDGEIHQTTGIREHDENRTAELDRFGINVLRFSNQEIENNIQKVLGEIVNYASIIKSKNIPSISKK